MSKSKHLIGSTNDLIDIAANYGLDALGAMVGGICRNPGETDESFRNRVKGQTPHYPIAQVKCSVGGRVLPGASGSMVAINPVDTRKQCMNCKSFSTLNAFCQKSSRSVQNSNTCSDYEYHKCTCGLSAARCTCQDDLPCGSGWVYDRDSKEYSTKASSDYEEDLCRKIDVALKDLFDKSKGSSISCLIIGADHPYVAGYNIFRLAIEFQNGAVGTIYQVIREQYAATVEEFYRLLFRNMHIGIEFDEHGCYNA